MDEAAHAPGLNCRGCHSLLLGIARLRERLNDSDDLVKRQQQRLLEVERELSVFRAREILRYSPLSE